MKKPQQIPPLTTKQIERFWLKVDRRGSGECWLWTGNKTRHARGGGYYGLLSIGGRGFRPHRVAYTLCVGPIPEGLTIDHVEARGCTNTLCCNPAHLEAVTWQENKRRGAESVKYCKRGHSLKKWRGRRGCALCGRMYAKAYSYAVKNGIPEPNKYALRTINGEAA